MRLFAAAFVHGTLLLQQQLRLPELNPAPLGAAVLLAGDTNLHGQERALFDLLITVKNVGPSTAIAIRPATVPGAGST